MRQAYIPAALIASALLVGGPAAAEDEEREVLMSTCVQPAAPSLPDGAAATREEILEAQSSVRTYIEEAESYLECLAKHEKELPEDADPEERVALVERHNETVDTMKAVAEDFNAVVRTYKAQSAQ